MGVNHAFTFFCGLTVGIFAFIIWIASGPFDYPHTLWDFSKDQGSTIGAFVTTIAILIAIWVHFRELASDREREERARNRRANSYRARMSGILSELIVYCRDAYTRLEYDHPYPAPVMVPDSNLDTLSDAIEFLDDVSSQTLTTLISEYQIFQARMESNLNQREDLVLYLINIHMQTEYLFNFARHENLIAVRVPRTRQTMLSALNSITDHTYTGLYYIADQNLITTRYQN